VLTPWRARACLQRKLQEQLAAVQMQSAVHHLSERNCVEIILKLLQTKSIEARGRTGARVRGDGVLTRCGGRAAMAGAADFHHIGQGVPHARAAAEGD
jgi:hypothetical protein